MRLHLWSILLATTLAACAGSRPPASFLHADSSDWNTDLNVVVDINLRNIPLGDLGKYAPFQQMNVVFSGVDTSYRITLEVKQVTRRQALWMIARQYGLSINVDRSAAGHPLSVVISNS